VSAAIDCWLWCCAAVKLVICCWTFSNLSLSSSLSLIVSTVLLWYLTAASYFFLFDGCSRQSLGQSEVWWRQRTMSKNHSPIKMMLWCFQRRINTNSSVHIQVLPVHCQLHLKTKTTSWFGMFLFWRTRRWIASTRLKWLTVVLWTPSNCQPITCTNRKVFDVGKFFRGVAVERFIKNENSFVDEFEIGQNGLCQFFFFSLLLLSAYAIDDSTKYWLFLMNSNIFYEYALFLLAFTVMVKRANSLNAVWANIWDRTLVGRALRLRITAVHITINPLFKNFWATAWSDWSVHSARCERSNSTPFAFFQSIPVNLDSTAV
jgi:hypothetical protein